MPEPIVASVLTLARLFSPAYRFHLSHFQRAYAWRVEHAGRLLGNIIEASGAAAGRGYFLGRLLLARDGDATTLAVIDGHQRMLTLTILFAVLRDLESRPEVRLKLDGLIREIAGGTDDAGGMRVVPNASLAAFFVEHVQADGATERAPEVDYASLSESEANVVANRDHLRATLAGEDFDAGARERLADFLCQQGRVVTIEVEDEAEAWQHLLIEEQTHLEFSAADRSKASLLAVMTADERGVCAPIWDRWQGRLGTTDMQALLEHIRTLTIRKRSGAPVEIDIARLFDLPNRGLQFFRDHLEPRAALLADLRKGEVGPGDARARIAQRITYMSWIDTQLWVPPAQQWLARRADDAETASFFARLERLVWFMRMSGTDPTVTQNRIIRLLGKIDAGAEVEAIEELAIESRMRLAALVNLRSPSFCAKHYANAVLRRISAALGADPGPVDRVNVTVEHILPRSPKSARDWHQSFRSKTIILNYANRLGNLTFLTALDNQAAGDRDWSHKQAVLKDSDFFLSSRAARETAWTPATIERRTEELIKILFEA